MTSHELRTPITAIRGQAQLALRRIDKQATEVTGLRESFAQVESQTQRLTDLINELLDFSGLCSGKMALKLDTCNFNAICSAAVQEQSQLSERVIELKLPSAPVLLWADGKRLGQVVTNLVSNALKYSPADSQVSVEVRIGVSVASMRVRDHGQGIPAEYLTSIFKPFYRTASASDSSISGAGLGLSICQEIVAQHQGYIWCESTSGDGSLFIVELPLHSENANNKHVTSHP